MKNFLKSLTVILFSALALAQNLPNISTQTKGQLPVNRLNAPGVAGLCLQTDGSGNVALLNCSSSGGSGTVTNFSASNLTPLFSVSVLNPTTTPALSFSLSNFAAHTFYGNNTSVTATPGAQSIGLADLPGLGVTTINTTAPLGGGGSLALGSSLTFTCASCITSIPQLPITKTAVASNWINSYDSTTGLFTATRPAYTDLTGLPQLAITKSAIASNWLRSYDSTTGLFTASQPAYVDISGTPQLANTKAAIASNWINSYNSVTGLFTATQPATSDLSDFPSQATHSGQFLTTNGTVLSWGSPAGAGSVTSFSSGNLSPLFTTSVATPTSTPSQTFSLSTAAAHTFFGNNTASTATPAYEAIGNGDLPGSGSITLNTTGPITGGGAVALGGSLTFACASCLTSVTAHNLLSATHGDTTAHSVVRGDLIAGIGVVPTWTAVAKGGTNTYPKWNASGDVISSTLGASGIGSCAANQFETTDNADAAPTCAQPAYSGITGTPAVPTGTGYSHVTSGALDSASKLVNLTASTDVAANQGTTTTLLHGNAAGNPSFAGVNLINDASANQGTVNQLLHGNAAGQPSFSAVASADLNITTSTCTNQFVTAISASGVGTCTTDTLASAQHANQGTVNTVLHGNAAGNPAFSAVTSADTTGTFTATAHNLLSATHGDSTTGTVARGDVITGQGASPTWTRLAKGTANQVLSMDGTATDVLWTTPSGGTVTSIATTGPITGGTITSTGTIACATCGVTGSPLSQFSATTSAQLAGVISDETGSGVAVFSNAATINPKNLDTIIYSDQFALGNWCDDVVAADTLLGSKGGQIWISTADGVFCSGAITVRNSLRFINAGDFVTKGINIAVGGVNIDCMGLTNSGSTPFSTRLLYNGVAGGDAISILGTAGARLDKNTISNCLVDGNNVARYALRVEKADGMTISDSRFQGAQTANTYMVDAIDWKWYNVGLTFCQGNTGAGICGIFDWGSGNGAWIGGQTEQSGASTKPQIVVSGAINNIAFIAQDWDATTAFGGFLLIQGQDANSAFAGAPTGGTGRPINITVSHSLMSTSTAAPSQGSDVLVTDATSAQQPANINFDKVEFNGNSVSTIAVKADQAQNVKLKDSFSNGHTTATFSATANAIAPEMVDNLLLDTARVTGTTASVCDIWNTTGLENYNCNLIFNQQANKLGQADIVADSGAINTTETIIVKTPALVANRLIAGTHLRFVLEGTCTPTVANTSTFNVRFGTAGTTADTSIANYVTPASGTSGTNVAFKVVVDFTVRTTGSSATGVIQFALDSSGLTGISATQTPQLNFPTMSTFNTTTAGNIVSVTYKSAATTTTSTFKIATVEIVQN